MTVEQWFTVHFGVASKGLMRVLQEVPHLDILPDGNVSVLGKPLSFVFAKGINDYFSIAMVSGKIEVKSGSAVGFFMALESLTHQASSGKFHDDRIDLRFKHRLYKLEAAYEMTLEDLQNVSANTILITRMPEEFWHSLFQRLAKKGFNIFILYAGSYHSFEYFLDYSGFPHGADSKLKKLRAKNFKALERMFQIAKEYGFETFTQHYVSHFTQSLSNHLKLGLDASRGARLANFDHPEIDAYTRYIYQKTFETLPDLDGLIFNFESCGNSKEFLERTLIPVLKKLKRKPTLYFRLWGISKIEAVKDVIEMYDGPSRLLHKSHDTNDVYGYPVADERVKLWKKAMPEVEFAFSMGPCHNCGTNLSSKIWTDPEYVYQLMNSMLEKGADSVSFQATNDIQVYFLKGTDSLSDWKLGHSKHNFGHMEAFCDFVAQRKIDPKVWYQRYADVYGVTVKTAEYIFKATVHASRVMVKPKWQYYAGSSVEGYLFPSRNSYYQDPFFYFPLSSLNILHKVKYKITQGSWLYRNEPVKVVPDDTQYVIDFANPAVKKKVKNNPAELVRQMQEHNKIVYKSIAAYKKLVGKKADQEWIQKILLNTNWGERAWREIEISIALSRCYFSKTKKEFFTHLRRAHQLMLDTVKKVNIRDSQQYLNINGSGPFIPDKDAIEVGKILACEKDDFPFTAFAHHLKSHIHYNEIRRYMRPHSSMRNEKIEYAENLLKLAMAETQKSLKLLVEEKYALYRHNVEQWHAYLQAEIRELRPPAMICYQDDSIASDVQFQRFTHDQCFLYGEFCWEDFGAFFHTKKYFRQDNIECRATWSDKGLILSVRENGIQWTQREEVWDKNTGSVNQTGFLQIYLEDGVEQKRLHHLTLFFKGEGGTQQFMEERNGKKFRTKPQKLENYSANFTHTDSGWRIDVTLPWNRFKKKPKKGDVWRLNLFSNPAVVRNHRGIWCQGYEINSDLTRLGTIYFA